VAAAMTDLAGTPDLAEPQTPGRLLAAETEVRHLKNTIAALREQLEATQYGQEADVQRAVAESTD
jgi:hypothetical protein